ncbi:Uncharacterised protein [Mycobacteroides abscessus subsp. abscessus]|nr:Uncharacterised protein [Mycobacteroides abscessus subsp. abscessus]
MSGRVRSGQRSHRATHRVGAGVDERRLGPVLRELAKQQRVVSRIGDAGGECVEGTGDVLVILTASRVAAPGGGREHEHPPMTVGVHLLDGVLDHRLPVAVAEVDRKVASPSREFGTQRLDHVQVQSIDRRHPTEVVVVLGDGFQSLARDASTARDVLEEWHHLVGPVGSAEREEQHGVECRAVLCARALRSHSLRKFSGNQVLWLAPPSTYTIEPVVPGSQSLSRVHTLLPTTTGSLTSQPMGDAPSQ